MGGKISPVSKSKESELYPKILGGFKKWNDDTEGRKTQQGGDAT